MDVEFSEKARAELDQVIARYPTREGAILPALYLVQQEFGYVSLEAMERVAEIIGVSPARIYGVATFYTMFNKEPVGKYLIQVCCNLPCALMGAEEVFQYISEKLGIKEGETTPDKKFTLMKVECLGACGDAPMMQINDEYYLKLTPEMVDKILDSL